MVRRGDTVVMTGRSDTVHAAAQLADRVAPGMALAMIADATDAEAAPRP